MSNLVAGPNTGSYSPFSVGFNSESRLRGLVISFTLMFLKKKKVVEIAQQQVQTGKRYILYNIKEHAIGLQQNFLHTDDELREE